jgi:hypothetical protein
VLANHQDDISESMTTAELSAALQYVYHHGSNKHFSVKSPDIVFLVENKKFPVNRQFLIVRSEYFRNLLNSGWKESSLSEISLKDVNPKYFEMVLQFLYSEQLPNFVSSEKTLGKNIASIDSQIFGLCSLAGEYGIHRLEYLCLKKIAKCVNATTVVDIQEFAKQYSPELENYCAQYLATLHPTLRVSAMQVAQTLSNQEKKVLQNV